MSVGNASCPRRRILMKKIQTNTAEETYKFGYDMAKDARQSDIIALIGDLGVGKTVFAKGFADGLGITEPVTSPTFTIVCEYTQGRLPLYHFDVYRIEDAEELFEIGFEEYLYGDGVCLIEWADKIMDELPEEAMVVEIRKVPGEDMGQREILIYQKWEYGETKNVGLSESGYGVDDAGL